MGGRDRDKGSRNRMFCYLLGLLMPNQSSVPLWYWRPESSTDHQNEVLGTAINGSDDPGTAWPLTQMQHLDGILSLPTEILGDRSGVKQRVHNNPTNPFSYLSVLLGYHSSVNITETCVCVGSHYLVPTHVPMRYGIRTNNISMATQLVTPPMNPNRPIALSTRTLTHPVQVGERKSFKFVGCVYRTWWSNNLCVNTPPPLLLPLHRTHLEVD